LFNDSALYKCSLNNNNNNNNNNNSDKYDWQLLFIVSQKVTHVTSHHHITACAQNVILQHERKHVDLA